MPLVCRQVPNRTTRRRFDEKKLARLLCTVVRQGGSRALFESEFEQVCVDPESRKKSSAAEALAVAEQALDASNQLLSADMEFLTRFNLVVGLLATSARLIGRFAGLPGIAVAILTTSLREIAGVRVGQVAAQHAANDAALLIIRRAAANEARFLRVAGG